MAIDKDCFSEIYRTRDGLGFFTFHYQRRDGGMWWFSYRQSQSYKPHPEEAFTPADIQFHGESYDELRKQAGEFAESLHAIDTRSHTHLALPAVN